MKEQDIEILLKKAPQPPAPDGLLEKLQSDVKLPRGGHGRSMHTSLTMPVWWRWFPALSFGLLCFACLVGLAVQTKQLFDVRSENQSLRAGIAALERLRGENAELQRLRVAAEEQVRREGEAKELERLRAEVAALRAREQEIAALKEENQRLQMQRAAAAAQAGVAKEEDPFAEAQRRAKRIQCINNIKQIGLAARMWAHDNKDIMPKDFQTVSNELTTPKVLTCPADEARTRCDSWSDFDGSSVSYHLLSPGVPETDPAVVFVRCSVHDNAGLVDGSAQQFDSTKIRIEQVDGKYKMIPFTEP